MSASTHSDPEWTFAENLDRQRASFDKLRMRYFLRAIKIAPHPELVEGRTIVLQQVRRSCPMKPGVARAAVDSPSSAKTVIAGLDPAIQEAA
jgi:hypothetical protein